MKLLSFSRYAPGAGRTRHVGALVAGEVDGGTVIDVGAALRRLLVDDGADAAGAARLTDAVVGGSMSRLIAGGPRCLALVAEATRAALDRGWEADAGGAAIAWPTDRITWDPVIDAPPMLRDFMGFEAHLQAIFPRLGREIPEQWYQRPVYYKGNTAALGAHEQTIDVPDYEPTLDLEFEIAAVLGRGGTDIAEADARAHIVGYTIYNDFSARRIQGQEMTVGLGPAKGKDFHGGHTLGPLLVTADEIVDPYDLNYVATVNGEQWTSGSTGEMHWRFEQMIAYASASEPLRAGEVFGSGTVGGGSGAEQDKALAAGDVIELEVEGLGRLRNRIGSHR